MSVDVVLTPNPRTGPAVTHEPGPGLRFNFVGGAGFEPATSGLTARWLPDSAAACFPLTTHALTCTDASIGEASSPAPLDPIRTRKAIFAAVFGA